MGLLEEPSCDDALAHLQAEASQASFPWREQRQRSSSRLAVQLDGYSLEAGTLSPCARPALPGAKDLSDTRVSSLSPPERAVAPPPGGA